MSSLIRLSENDFEDLLFRTTAKNGSPLRSDVANMLGINKRTLKTRSSIPMQAFLTFCELARVDFVSVLKRSQVFVFGKSFQFVPWSEFSTGTSHRKHFLRFVRELSFLVRQRKDIELILGIPKVVAA